jgi:nitrite reductase/ring-hydroxylating ferredoxin subunit
MIKLLNLFLFSLFRYTYSYSSFFNQWICIGVKDQIKWDKPYKINIGELPLVLWRDPKKNEILAALNICKHMGSKLDNGFITKQGCLKCNYHGLEYTDLDQFGNILEQDGKIFWAYKPTRTSPFKIPFFNNPNYEKSFLTIDMDASLTDSAFNTMDLRHPEFVHGD